MRALAAVLLLTITPPAHAPATEVIEELMDCRAWSERLSTGAYGYCTDEPVCRGFPKLDIPPSRPVCAPYDRSALYACFCCGDTYSTYNHPLCQGLVP